MINEYDVYRNQRSCHSALVNDYIVKGDVPGVNGAYPVVGSISIKLGYSSYIMKITPGRLICVHRDGF